MNEDERGIAYNRGFEAGRSHADPSPATLKFMEETKEFIAKANVKIETLCDDFKEMKETIPTKEGMKLAMKEALAEFRKDSNQIYASKTTEKVVYGMVGVILTVVLGFLLKNTIGF